MIAESVQEQNKSEADADASADVGQYKTGLPIETIQQVARQLTDIPEDFNAHPGVKKILLRRRQMVESAASRVDFSFAELLAFCTLSLRRPKGESLATFHRHLNKRTHACAGTDCVYLLGPLRGFTCGNTHVVTRSMFR